MITIKQLKHAIAAISEVYDDKEFHCCESLNGHIEALRLSDCICSDEYSQYCLIECIKDHPDALLLGD